MKEIYQKKRFQQDFNERKKNLGKKNRRKSTLR